MHTLLPSTPLTPQDLDPSHTKTIGSYVLGILFLFIKVKLLGKEHSEK